MFRFLPLLVTFLLVQLSGKAQQQWRYLPNNGFVKGSVSDTGHRIEDIYFLNKDTGFAVTLTNRLFKTTNGGIDWAFKNDTASYTGFRSIEFLDDGTTGIAGALNQTGKVLRTTDGGETWADIAHLIPDTTTNGAKRICGISHFGNNFYAVGWWGSTTAKFYKSTDGGTSWSTQYIDTTLATALVDVCFLSADTGFVVGKRENKGKSPASVILKTTDGGNNWHEVFSDSMLFAGYAWKIQFVNRDVAVASIQNLYIIDSVNMLYSANGGNNWSIKPVGRRLPTINFGGGTQAVGFISPAKGWVGGYYDGIFETNDSGKSWQHIPFGYDFNRIYIIDSTTVYAGGNMPYRYGGPPSEIKNLKSGSQASHKLFHTYPNPTKGNVEIKFELSKNSNIVLNIVNTDARRIYPILNDRLSKGMHRYVWNSNNAPAGNYIIWLGNDEIPLVQKFVLLK